MMGIRTTNSAVASGGPKRLTDAPFNSRVARQANKTLRMALLQELQCRAARPVRPAWPPLVTVARQPIDRKRR